MLVNLLKKIVFMGMCCCCFPTIVTAQDNQPFVIYDNELKNNWQNWSFAEVALSVPVGNTKPIKVEGKAWSALAFHHEPFSIDEYSKLSFFVNGGLEGGQTLTVKLVVEGKPIASTYMVQPKVKTWALAEVPLAELGANGRKIDGIWLQAQGEPYSAYYITKIQFE